MTKPKTPEELYALIEEATLNLALLKRQEAELAALAPLEGAPQGFPAQAMAEARLGGALSRQKRRAAFKTWAPRALKAAAALLLVFYLGLTTALAAVPSLRHSLMVFMIHSEKEYTELALIPTGDALDIPQGWQGAYYPAYVPEGFRRTHLDVKDAFMVWEDDAGGFIRYDEETPSASTNIDTENAEIEYVSVHGRPALLSYKKGLYILAWAEDTCYFVLDGTISRQEILQMAENVVRIN